jgi:predicted alpha/beta hydrolase family esterase
MTTNFFIIPGLGDSGPEHWQTWFEKSGNNFQRINQSEWEAPDCHDWVSTIDKVISNFDPSTTVLIGHSLGCTAIVQWATQFNKTIKAALLVAPSDVENPAYAFPATGFTPIPTRRINFNTIVVASADDPWVSLDRARFFAQCWGSEFINIGKAGHINAASGFGDWKQGLEILKKLE